MPYMRLLALRGLEAAEAVKRLNPFKVRLMRRHLGALGNGACGVAEVYATISSTSARNAASSMFGITCSRIT